MKYDIEKYFPLPLRYDAVRGLIKDANDMPLMQMDYSGMGIDQAENDCVLGTYLAKCANLMPAAEGIISAVLEFVKRSEEEGIQIVGTAMKDNEPVGMVDVGDVLKDRCQMFLDKLNRQEDA